MVLNILEGLAIYSTRHVSANTNIESYHHLGIRYIPTRFLGLGPRIGMLLVAQGRLIILLFIVVIFRHGSVSHTPRLK